jgi:preprotein translocase SecF subunit
MATLAGALTIVGYSVNDTVVVFDRIREELKLNPTGTLKDIVNRSLNLTLSRTIVTGGTTLLTLEAATG